MSQRLRINDKIIKLEKAMNIPIIDHFSSYDSVVFLIDSKNRRKIGEHKFIIKKLSKQLGKFLIYIFFPCSIREAAKQCIFPVEIIDLVVRKNNGEKILIYLLDQSIKDSVMNMYGSKFKLSEVLLKKHFSVDNIRVEGINPDLYSYYGKRMLSKILG